IGSIIFLIILGKFFAIPFLLIIPMLVGAYMIISWSTFKLARKSLEEEIKLHKQAEDTARYIRLIKAFNMEELYKKRFVLNLNKIKDIAMKRVKLMELTFFSQQIIFYGMTGLILIMASFFIGKIGFSAGLITTLFLYAHKYMGSTFQLGQNLITLQKSIVSFKRLKEIEANYLSKKEEIKTKQAKKVLPIQKKAKIRFKNLYFRYNESFVLNNISFEIFEGEKIALVGPSGSGKSTIFQLMLGFYSPEKGEIFFDEIPYLFYDKENMQKEFSYIPQEEMIFPGTIMENVTVDGAKIDNKRFKDVLKLSGLDSISPNEDALSLSVGQKQRIAWARAIYKDAPIFIFDEPTSNIDPIHTFVMLKNLISIYKDKTLIMACHHMELIELVERIIVIENGRIKEIGTHDELIKRNGIYYELLNSRYLVANI
ncbi:MAG: ABC transporter ATP-binding protein, partial [Deltaproteobacteria bacterium]|nr:ABC transporter ATP-binding protein [Deltaproteobacteria bacterium]